MTAKSITVLCLLLIILLASLVRFYHLSQVPNGFFFDEATISYQAYSLIKTGKDTWDNTLPLLSFKDYGEHVLPVGVYLQTVTLALGGLTVFAARLPHALVGIFCVVLLFMLAKELFKSTKVALLSAFFSTVSPLFLGWTRFVFEGNFGTLFLLTGVYFFVWSIKKRQGLTWAVIFFGLSMLSYHVFLVVSPLIFLSIFLLNRKNVILSKRAIVLGAVFLLWAALAVYSGAGRQRFSQASTLLSPQKIDILNHQIGYCQQSLPTPLCKLFLNKITTLATSYLENYTGHFSPAFLAFDGTFLRQNVLPKSGILLPIEMFGFALGLFYLIKIREFPGKILLPIIIFYPAANSFTGVGEISRIAFAAPFLSLISAYGLIQAIRVMRLLKPLILIVTIYYSTSFLLNYFVIFPITNAYYTNFGYDKVFSWVRQNQAQYDRILITRNYAGSVSYISTLFFLPVDPIDFHTGKVDRFRDVQNYFVTTRIGKLHFYTDLKSQNLKPNDFLIATPEEIKQFGTYPLEFTIIDPTGRILLLGLKSHAILEKTSEL